MAGSLMPKLDINGVTVGSQNWGARLNRVNTNWLNGNISNISTKTWIRGGLQPAIRNLPETMTTGVYGSMHEKILRSNGLEPRR